MRGQARGLARTAGRQPAQFGAQRGLRLHQQVEEHVLLHRAAHSLRARAAGPQADVVAAVGFARQRIGAGLQVVRMRRCPRWPGPVAPSPFRSPTPCARGAWGPPAAARWRRGSRGRWRSIRVRVGKARGVARQSRQAVLRAQPRHLAQDRIAAGRIAGEAERVRMVGGDHHQRVARVGFRHRYAQPPRDIATVSVSARWALPSWWAWSMRPPSTTSTKPWRCAFEHGQRGARQLGQAGLAGPVAGPVVLELHVVGLEQPEQARRVEQVQRP